MAAPVHKGFGVFFPDPRHARDAMPKLPPVCVSVAKVLWVLAQRSVVTAELKHHLRSLTMCFGQSQMATSLGGSLSPYDLRKIGDLYCPQVWRYWP